MTSCITHTASTAAINIIFAGIYELTFSVSGSEINQFAFYRNGTMIPGGVYGSGDVNQQNIGHVIVLLTAGDVITVRNHTSAGAITLATTVGGSVANVNASIMIEKLG